MMWFVPTDVTGFEVEGNETPEDAWRLVHAIIGWEQNEVEFEHEHKDGEICNGTYTEATPIVLDPCKGGDIGALGHAPGRVWYGEGMVFAGRGEAMIAAQTVLAEMLKDKAELDNLEAMVAGVESGSGDVAEDS